MITQLGGLLGIKTAPLVARLAPHAERWSGPLVVTIPHRFNAMTVTATVPRHVAHAICGPWLDGLAGDQIALELGATTATAHSEDAALPDDAPAAVKSLGDDLVSVGFDGESWMYAVEQDNADDAAVDATIARFDPIAQQLGVTEPSRKIGGRLHRSLSRGMPSRVWLRAKAQELDPIVTLAWDRVEWLPIQHMMAGFYPSLDTETKLGRIARATGIEEITVELVLGPVDPPGMRLLVPLA